VRTRLLILVGVPGLAVAVSTRTAQAEPPAGVTFTRVADTSTVIPAGQWEGQHFDGVLNYALPAIDHGNVIFAGQPATAGAARGVYSWKDGALGLIADPSTPPPGGGPPLSAFIHLTVRDGEYAFDEGGYRVYRTVNGALTNVPRVGRYNNRPSLDGGKVWFFADESYYDPGPGGPPHWVHGVYGYDGTSHQQIAQTGPAHPTPGLPAGYYFTDMDTRVVARDGQVIFGALSGRAEGDHEIGGLYMYANGYITRIVDSTTIPGYYTGPSGSFDFDADTVGFIGHGSVWVVRDGEFQRLAASGQPAPGGGTWVIAPTITYDRISVDQRRVAFASYTTQAEAKGIYIVADEDAAPWRLVGAGDLLSGQTIASADLGPDALSGDRIVFWARFTNGNSGVFVATIPEPAIQLVVLCLVIGGARAPIGRRTALRKEEEKVA
jgi:hypothetical protein